MSERRMLLVHAHPDDESIVTGATMARYAAEGVQVTLVTCTLGEEGEILLPGIEHLVASEADQLGGYRIGELAEAMRALGITDHRFLGGAGRFRDSGMMDTPANDHPRAFWRAAKDDEVFDAAVAEAVAVVREVRPQVVITYDTRGDYGHPDHIMAHRVAMAAVERAADAGYGEGEPWQVSKVYWTATPKSQLRHGFELMKEHGQTYFEGIEDVDELPWGVEDEFVTTRIDSTGFGDAKHDALSAHRSQIAVDGPFFALSNLVGREIMAVEHFHLAVGELGPDRDERGWETDLFSGIES